VTYLRSLLAAAVGALALITAPAIAQDYYYDEGDDIIVEAPGVVRERTGRRSSSGIPIEELTLQVVVTTSDLDLRYSNADVDELYRRIDYTVRDACNEVERASQGVPITTERQCIREATRDAYAQADALVYARRG
jgi:UrcA family protein